MPYNEEVVMFMRMKKHLDMTTGPFYKKILLFVLPLIASELLQIFFNAADVIIVGKFAGDKYLAAVGSTTSLVHLIVNFAIGLTTGTAVIVSQAIGAKNKAAIDSAVHTSMTLSVIAGIVIGAIGFFACPVILDLMGTEETILLDASVYTQIYFAGLPALMVYNFAAAILRSDGDTRAPLIYLLISGVLNVILNIFFVTVLHMTADGVALATVISQVVSAVLIVIRLLHYDGDIKLCPKRLRLDGKTVVKIIAIGIPAGLQSSLFSFANVIIQSAVNSFGSVAIIAGNSTAASIEGFAYVFINCIAQATTAFVGQNVGAGNYENVKRLIKIFCVVMAAFTVSAGVLFYLLRVPISYIYTDSSEVVMYVGKRLMFLCLPYFLCGLQEVFAAAVKSMGHALLSVTVTVLSICVLRILWVLFIFPLKRELEMLYVVYPISWIFALIGSMLLVIYYYKKDTKQRGKL